jgi:hypothetical protein
MDHAQIKLEGVKLEAELAASIYVPLALPSTLVVSGYVLEHNDPSASDRPEWIFFQTSPQPLKNGAWNQVRFSRTAFLVMGRSSGDSTTSVVTTWRDPPLLLGFEIRNSTMGPVDGTVYFDQITVR